MSSNSSQSNGQVFHQSRVNHGHGLSPIQTYQHTISCTHLNAWQYCYNAHEMQCMKFLRSNLQNPYQKFYKAWNVWKWGIWNLPSEEKLEYAWRILAEEVEGEWERFWEKKRLDRMREIERNEIRNHERPLYSPSVNLNRSRSVEDLSSFKGFNRSIYWACIQGKRKLDGSRICRGAIEGINTFSIDPPSYWEVSRIYWGCFKTVFQEGKNTDMNTIKHATQPRIQPVF